VARPIVVGEGVDAPKAVRSRSGQNRFAQLLLVVICALIAHAHAASNSVVDLPPTIMREFRGAWIASMANIDWPSKPGLNASEQKAELRGLLDAAAKLRLNAVFLQVRPASDALYKSSLEPWSEFLTGLMGKAPEPLYDPLQFAVEEAHARGLELHAWFNPYRAGFTNTRYTSPRHVTKKHPKWVRRYGNLLWLDPAEPAVQNYVTQVILDVVRRYDIDGVHLDDYFYPYPEPIRPGGFRDFPDEITWKRYLGSGGKLPRNEWRRENVNKLVQRLQREIRVQKPWVMFGISPFGIWRPGFPSQIKGLDAYDSLYADARRWLIQGWVDYLAPQLYWPSTQREQSYPVLYDWWSSQSPKNLPIWPGGDVTRAGSSWPADEIVQQVQLTRKSSSPGYVHWHLGTLARNADLRNRLAAKVYTAPAIVPQLRNVAMARPAISATKQSGGKRLIKWSMPGGQKVSCWVLQVKRSNSWTTEVLPGSARTKVLADGKGDIVAISGVGRFRTLSPPAILR
jgi:uncharacterized lipoprotein YddW (UPF0748 family)